MTRRWLLWTAIPLIVAHLGCAARGVHVTPSGPPAVAVSEADRRLCEAYASAQARAVSGESVAGAAVKGGVEGLQALKLGPLGLLLAPVLIPVGVVAGPMEAARSNAKVRQATYDAGLRACMEPLVLTAELGPEHPDVALALDWLARGYATRGDYAEAERLYQRALTIQEKALGPNHPDVSATLYGYAVLLRKAHRDAEATELETRAEAIRAKAEPSSETHVAPDATPTPPEAMEPTTPNALTQPTPPESGE